MVPCACVVISTCTTFIFSVSLGAMRVMGDAGFPSIGKCLLSVELFRPLYSLGNLFGGVTSEEAELQARCETECDIKPWE